MEARELYHKTLYRQRVYLLTAEYKRKTTQQEDGRVYQRGFIPCVLFLFSRSCKVLFVLFVVCLPTTLHWSLTFFFFKFSDFFFVFWPLLNTRALRRRFTTALPLFTERRRRRRGPSDMADSHHFLSGPPHTHTRARGRLRSSSSSSSSKIDWSVKNVHLYINDIFLCNYFLFVSVSRRCSWKPFF